MNKKTLSILLSLSLCTSAVAPISAFASEGQNKGSVVESTNEYQIIENKNKVIVIDKVAHTKETVVFNDDRTEATVHLANGEVQKFSTNSEGNVELNGEVVLEKEVTPVGNSNVEGEVSIAAYQYVTTFKTKQSFYNTSRSIAIALIGLVPGLGTIATVAGIVDAARGFASNEVYITITQYYDSYTHMVKNVVRFYKYSNYTGLFKTSTLEHRLYS